MSSSAIPIIARMQKRVSPLSNLASTREICDWTHTRGARPKDARRAGFFSLDGECGGHFGRLLVEVGASDAVDVDHDF